jgi:hypothetical protein
MVLDPDITAVDPSQFFKRLAERCVASARLWIIRERVGEINEPRYATRLLRARRERPRRRRTAEERDEVAPFQLIELHSVPARQGGLQDIELGTISQEVTKRFYNLLFSRWYCSIIFSTENICHL